MISSRQWTGLAILGVLGGLAGIAVGWVLEGGLADESFSFGFWASHSPGNTLFWFILGALFIIAGYFGFRLLKD